MTRWSLILLSWVVVFLCEAATLQEDFSSDPRTRGWQVSGDASLFHWNSTNQDLEVTWNTEKTNSYFFHPLGNVLAKSDDFSVAFDLRLDDLNATFVNGYAFELSAGLLNRADATGTNFNRSNGTQSPNLVEFDYFPDTGFGATISPAVVSSNSQFAVSFTFPLSLTQGDWFHIVMTYTASNQTLVTTMTRNGGVFGPIKEVALDASFSDIHVDTLAVSSYRDNDADGSILAHGLVDNFVVTMSDPPIQNLNGQLTNNVWQVEFISRTNWLYTLERTEDFQSWSAVSPQTGGVEGALMLCDTNTPSVKSFYRVYGQRP